MGVLQDHRGIIRYKFLGPPPDDEDLNINKVIDELTTTATRETPSSAPPTE